LAEKGASITRKGASYGDVGHGGKKCLRKEEFIIKGGGNVNTGETKKKSLRQRREKEGNGRVLSRRQS